MVFHRDTGDKRTQPGARGRAVCWKNQAAPAKGLPGASLSQEVIFRTCGRQDVALYAHGSDLIWSTAPLAARVRDLWLHPCKRFIIAV